MSEDINKIYDLIFNELKTYVSEKSIYEPYIFKKEPTASLFPLVVFKKPYKDSDYTTLKYTDYIYNFNFKLNVYAIQNGTISSVTIANEITDIIETFFKDVYRMSVKINYDVPNIDTDVYNNQINVSCKVDTKYKDRLVIIP